MTTKEWHDWTQAQVAGKSVWRCAKCGKIYNDYIPFGWRPRRYSLLPCVPPERVKPMERSKDDATTTAKK